MAAPVIYYLQGAYLVRGYVCTRNPYSDTHYMARLPTQRLYRCDWCNERLWIDHHRSRSYSVTYVIEETP